MEFFTKVSGKQGTIKEEEITDEKNQNPRNLFVKYAWKVSPVPGLMCDILLTLIFIMQSLYIIIR